MNKVLRVHMLWEMLQSGLWIYSFPWEFGIYQYFQNYMPRSPRFPQEVNWSSGEIWILEPNKYGFLSFSVELRKTVHLLCPLSPIQVSS